MKAGMFIAIRCSRYRVRTPRKRPGRPLALLFATGLLAVAPSLWAGPEAPADTGPSDFEQCKTKLRQLAIEAGVSERTAREVLADARHLDRVIELDRQQPRPEGSTQHGALLVLVPLIGRFFVGRFNLADALCVFPQRLVLHSRLLPF